MMEIHETMRWLALPVMMGIVVWWCVVVRDDRLRAGFIASSTLLIASILPLYADTDLHEWVRHILYYASQLMYYYVLDRAATTLDQDHVGYISRPQSAHMGWLSFLTAEGFQHVLAMPAMFLMLSFMRLRSYTVESPRLRTALWWGVGATLAMTILHVGEFLIESQEILPLMDAVEYIEMVLIGLALMCQIVMISILRTTVTTQTMRTAQA